MEQFIGHCPHKVLISQRLGTRRGRRVLVSQCLDCGITWSIEDGKNVVIQKPDEDLDSVGDARWNAS